MSEPQGTLSAALEHEHHLIDAGVEAFADTDGGAVTEQHRTDLAQSVTLLRRHIYLEEEFLFPPLRAAGLMGPIMVMIHEHGEMWPLLDQLDQLLAGPNPAGAATVCRDLLGQLAVHNMKEERIVYPEADARLAPDEIADLTDKLTTEQLPDGWVCQGASG